MNPEREELLNRIRAMQAKADCEAATENEAMQAAAMAAKLLARHEVTLEEIALIEGGAEGVVMQRLNHGTKQMHHALKCAARGIETLTETKCYISTSVFGDQHLVFTGLDKDVEMALYLSMVIKGAADRAWRTSAKGRYYDNRNRSRKSFLIGFGDRVQDRLIELAEERKAAGSSDSTALVVRKGALIDDYLASQDIILESQRTREVVMDENYDLGTAAGDGVNLSPPIENAQTVNCDSYL